MDIITQPFCAMSLFRKKRLPRSEQAMAEASDLGPINLVLDGNHLTFDDGVWEADYEGAVQEGASGGNLEKELVELRREKKRMKKELEKYAAQVAEVKELREKWNLLDFKYQLLLDMWTMRVLDHEEEGGGGGQGQGQAQKSRSVRSSVTGI